ncbi:MAG: sulfatase-like hydrolase/transferase, partial [Planctomycetota bacterium]
MKRDFKQFDVSPFGLAFIILLCTSLPASVLASEPPPNVVIVLCDDLGYGDLGCYGHPIIRTPHLDQLADDGIRFTQCYAASAVCSSSRAGLLTGRNPNRDGIYDWLPNGIPVYLNPDVPNIASTLKSAGYQTALVGKWHLNGLFNQPEQPQPSKYGFDHWMATQNNASPSHANPSNFIRNGVSVGRLNQFSCQAVVGEALSWLDNVQADKPFFLHICFHEPHEPVASPDAIVASYRNAAKNENQAQYFANVTNLDNAVGRLVDSLRERDLIDNTLLFFTSDNGPETLNRYRNARRSYGVTGGLRGMKLHTFEGGIRVPGIMHWPARIKSGQTITTPISAVDLLPTFKDLVSGTAEAEPDSRESSRHGSNGENTSIEHVQSEEIVDGASL